MIHRLILISLILFPLIANSQGKRVIADNTGTASQPQISVKWFLEKVLSDEGVNVYRRQLPDSNWVKQTPMPLRKGFYQIPESVFPGDSTLRSYKELVGEVSSSEIEGYLKLMLLVKHVLSPPFARYIGVQYDDNKLTIGGQYQYLVKEHRGSREYIVGMTSVITAAAAEPGSPPAEIALRASDKSVFFNWLQDNMRFLAVNIYKSTTETSGYQRLNADPVIISEVPKPDGSYRYPDIFYTDRKVENGKNYYYKLTCINYFGRESAFSPAVKVTPRDTTPPKAPSFLRSRIETKQVHLSWVNVPSEDARGYHIFRSKSFDGPYQQITQQLLSLTDTSYTDIVPEAGNFYYYIASCDAEGNCDKSFPTLAQIADITPPAAPVNLTALADTGRIILRWEANTEADLAGYQIYRSTRDTSRKYATLYNAFPLVSNSFTDTLPRRARNAFVYWVAAIDTSLNRSPWSNFAMATMPDVFPPEKPFIKVVRESEGRIVVEWIPNADEDLMGYNIFRTVASDSTPRPKQLNVNLLDREVFRFTDLWAESNVRYYYSLIALDSAGNPSKPSEPYDFRKIELDTATYSITSAKGKYQKKKSRYTLTWSDKYKAEVEGYVVFRRENGQEFKPLSGLLTNPEYVDNGIKSEKVYFYQIKQFFKNGTIGESDVLELNTGKNE